MNRVAGPRGRSLTLLVTVLLVALSVRLLLFAYVSPRPVKLFMPDSYGYQQLADNLLRTGVFSEDQQAPFRPDLKRTPGYPAMIAAIYAAVGHAPEAVAEAQIALAVLTVVSVFLLTLRLGWPKHAAFLAALLLAAEPVSAMTSIQLLSETLFTLLLVASMLALAVWREESLLLWLVSSAVLLGLASLVRPVSQFLPLALAPLVGIALARPGARMWVPSLLLFLAVSLGITYSWAYRNYEVSGQFTLSTVADTNLLYYRAREVLASVEGVSQEDALARLEARVPPGASPADKAAIERAEAVALFREHPGETVSMLANGAARIFVDPGFTSACTLLDQDSVATECFPGEASMDEKGLAGKVVARLGQFSLVQKGVLLWSILISAVIYIGSILGVVVLARKRSWFSLSLLLIVVGYLVLLSAGSEAYSRFRVPILPAMSLLAAVGIGQGWQLLRRRESRRS